MRRQQRYRWGGTSGGRRRTAGSASRKQCGRDAVGRQVCWLQEVCTAGDTPRAGTGRLPHSGAAGSRPSAGPSAAPRRRRRDSAPRIARATRRQPASTTHGPLHTGPRHQPEPLPDAQLAVQAQFDQRRAQRGDRPSVQRKARVQTTLHWENAWFAPEIGGVSHHVGRGSNRVGQELREMIDIIRALIRTHC